MEIVGFIHYGINTYTGNEWGTGEEDEKLFNPTDLNATQWVDSFQKANVKEIILTTKHHDGFCLFPSKYTNHTVASSNWKGGKGDVVMEFTQACHKLGVKVALYLSPWDMNNECYGWPEICDYNEIYMGQQTELLTRYGKITEQWLDGAKGEDRPQPYNFQDWRENGRRLQHGMLFYGSDVPDLRWNGNEDGRVSDPVWSTIKLEMFKKDVNRSADNNHGQEDGDWWSPAEADFSIRPGWFWHEDQNNKVRSVENLVSLYLSIVGSNQVMVLNVPPSRAGLFSDGDVKSLEGFGKAINATFKNNLLIGGSASANSTHTDNKAENVLNGDYESFWAASEEKAELIVQRTDSSPFDIIMMQEYIALGQRVKNFVVYDIDNGEKKLFEGQTIGYKRMIKLEAPITTKKFKVVFTGNAAPIINNFALFKLSYQ